jgi:hypothetical protein
MHCGYPIVTSMDVATQSNKNFIFNLTKMKTVGEWGVFHELGHNMQRDWWTFDGAV